VPEPIGGAHTNHELATSLLDAALERTLADVWATDPASRLEQRYQKFRQMGNVGINEG
jgi:acetyl-CoA carboxylase carboxyl transferase subunit alpha